MIFKFNIENFFNSIRDYYLSLSLEGQLVTYILIILIFIAITLTIILVEQKRIAKKVANKKQVQPISEKTEVLDLNLDYGDIDESNEKTRNLKEITDKIQAAIDSKAIDLTSFEQDQEENSIISYNELINSIDKKQEEPREEVKKSELINKIETNDDIRLRINDSIPPIKEEKFKSSVFVSPIFGIQDPDKASVREETKEEKQEEVVTDKYSEEEMFLDSLINFRKNLE